MNDTPETDKEHQTMPMGGFTLDFARKLERERDEAVRSCHIWQSGHAELVEERDRWIRLYDAAIAERDNALSDWRQADTDSIRALHERNEAREQLSEWSILKAWGGTPEIINEFIKGQQTRIHYAQKVEEELAAAIAERDEARSRFNEIDLCQNAQSPCKWSLKLIDERDAAIAERDKARQQRDMMAEALEKVSRSWNYVEVAHNAIQSLANQPK